MIRRFHDMKEKSTKMGENGGEWKEGKKREKTVCLFAFEKKFDQVPRRNLG